MTTQSYDELGRLEYRSTNGGVETASWTYDLPGQEGLLGREEDSAGLIREFTYDALRRPTKVTTTIPETDSVQTDGGVRVFTMEYGYDRNHGRLKATRYPSAVNTIGETVALDYDGRGYLLGEVALDGTYARTKAYRRVQGMSERGQVTEQRLGNCVREVGVYDPSTGAAMSLTAMKPTSPLASLPTTDLANCPAPSLTLALVRQDAYRFDRFMNLKRQTKNVAGSQREERFTYDALQRLTRATLCTGADCAPTTEVVDYEYDDLGNLTKKSDYGASYLYGTVTWDADSDPDHPRWVRGTGNAGPHAVHKVTKSAAAGGGEADFIYDANGNLTDGDGRHIDFDLMDRPVRVQMGGAETEFSYGPTGGRYRQKVTENVTGAVGPGFGPKTVYYVDKDYELTVWDTGSTQPGALEERTFIGPSVTVLTKKTAAGVKTRSVRYRHVDRLGSPDADTAEDVGATLVEAHGFDAWGKPRTGQRKFDSQGQLVKEMWASDGDQLHPGGEPGTASTRGFTGHEHLDSAYLIHMNGRVYDYRLGRFLSVDPIISNPLSSQAINPYSYIGNNPLSGTDPTGYCPEGKEMKTGSHVCTGLDPNEVVGIKQTGTNADGTRWTRIELFSNAFATGQGTTLANTNPTDHHGPRDVSAGRQTNWGAFGKGLVIGVLNAFLPGTSRLGLPSGLAGDPDAVAGQGIGQLATAIVQGKVATDMTVSGAVGGVLTSETGVGALAGAGISAAGLALGGVAAVNAGEGIQTLGRAMEMRGSGNGGGGALDPSSTPVYRGGSGLTFKPHEIRLDANGMVTPTHGVSVNTSPAGLERFGGARQIKSVPEGLQIIQRGSSPTHYEIVPRAPMPPTQFQHLLNQVTFH